MTRFDAQPDTLSRMGMTLNDAMRAVMEDLMRQSFGTVDRFFIETGTDKRNFYKVMSRSPQTRWLEKHLDVLGSDLGSYFDDVVRRQRESA